MRKSPIAGRAALAVLLALVAGCGLPDDDEPRLVGADDAPVDLAPSSPPATTQPGVGEVVDVYFVDSESGHLEAVPRIVEELGPSAVLTSLLEGPQEGDPDDLTTAIPADTGLIDTRAEGNVLVVNLTAGESGGILSVVGTDQLRAFGQMVRTVTGLPGISAVRFAVDGQPINAPTDSGATANPAEPVDRGDYASLAPERG